MEIATWSRVMQFVKERSVNDIVVYYCMLFVAPFRWFWSTLRQSKEGVQDCGNFNRTTSSRFVIFLPGGSDLSQQSVTCFENNEINQSKSLYGHLCRDHLTTRQFNSAPLARKLIKRIWNLYCVGRGSFKARLMRPMARWELTMIGSYLLTPQLEPPCTT